jgi:hypothetical protein
MESPTYSRRRKRATRRLAAAAIADWLGRRVVLLAAYRDFTEAERDGQTIRDAGVEASVVLDVCGVGGPACVFVLYSPTGAEAKRAARILRAASRAAFTNWRDARRSRRVEVAQA